MDTQPEVVVKRKPGRPRKVVDAVQEPALAAVPKPSFVSPDATILMVINVNGQEKKFEVVAPNALGQLIGPKRTPQGVLNEILKRSPFRRLKIRDLSGGS